MIDLEKTDSDVDDIPVHPTKLEREMMGKVEPRHCRKGHLLKFMFKSSHHIGPDLVCSGCMDEIDGRTGYYYCIPCHIEICNLCVLDENRAD